MNYRRLTKLSFCLLPLALLTARPAPAADNPKQVKLEKLLDLAGSAAVKTAGDRKIRLAVMPLRPAGAGRYADNGFGAYLTEQLFTALSSCGPKVRLYERTLLDNVLKEQALAAGGVIEKSDALKLGELAPIDYILSGTFTRLESSISINLRFIDALTGEASGSLAADLAVNDELAALFLDSTRPGPAVSYTYSDEPDCEPVWAPLRKLMEDVGTAEKQDKLVGAAVAVGFAPPCGAIHHDIIYLFSRHQLASSRYDKFLLETLRKIESPDKDRRAAAIADHLLSAPAVSEEVWGEVLRVAAASVRFGNYLEGLIYETDGSAASRKRQKARLDRIMKLAEARGIGRPVPAEPGEVFLSVLTALRSLYLTGNSEKKDPAPVLDFYRAYGPKYAAAAGEETLKLLEAVHGAAVAGEDKALVLGWYFDLLNKLKPSRETADTTTDLLRGLLRQRKDSPADSAAGKAASQTLKRAAAAAGPRIAEQLPLIIGRDYRLELTAFCLEHGIKGGGLPDLTTLVKSLSSVDDAARGEAIFLLKALGPAASQTEPAVLKLLSRTEEAGVQKELIALLGLMRTANPKAHALIIERLYDQDSYVADSAVLALAAIGEPAAGAVKAGISAAEESYKKVRFLKIFELRGAAAAGHLPWLKSVLAKAEDKYVRNAAEDAIEAAGGR